MKRLVEVPGWTIEKESYVVMEPREVTIMQQRTVPSIHYTQHTEWRPVEIQRLQPIPARLETTARRAEEEKEPLTTSMSAGGRGEPGVDSGAGVIEGEAAGVLVTELGLRVEAVHGRHNSNGALLVCDVSDRSVASNAGVQAGDVLISVNGSEVGSAEQLRAAIDASNGSLLLRALRHGRRHLTFVVQR